jgi:Leucine-rich repeat (LRR) protein
VLDDLSDFNTLRSQRLLRLPSRIVSLCNLRLLDLANNEIADIPEHLCITFPHLTTLNLAHNTLRTIPPGLCHPSIRSLDLSGNRIAAIPPEFYACRDMEHLILTGNCIRLCGVCPSCTAHAHQ